MSDSNKRRRTDWSITDIFFECGLRNDAFQSTLVKHNVSQGLGFSLDENSTPTTFANSLHGLLSELLISSSDQMMEEFEEKMDEELDALVGGSASRAMVLCALMPLCHSSKNLRGNNGRDDDDSNASNPGSHKNDDGNEVNQSSNEGDNMDAMFDVSLVKVLSRLESVQTSLLKLILQKLPQLILIDDEDDESQDNIGSPQLTKLILSHVRWMDQVIVKPSTVIETALQCLSLFVQQDQDDDSGNEVRAMQLDLIALMPDIVGNCASYQHNSDEGGDEQKLVVDALQEIRSDDPSLLIPCLDALSNMQLTSGQLDVIIKDTLVSLQSIDCSALPAIVRFLVQRVPLSSASALIEALRLIHLGEDNSNMDNDNDSSRVSKSKEASSEALMLEALAQGMQYRIDLADTLLSVIQKLDDNGTADVWLLLCCGCTPQHRKKVYSIFRQKTSSESISKNMLKAAIIGNGVSLSFMFHSSIIGWCDTLVRAPEKLAREAGSLAYFLLFFEYTDPIQRQEIIGALVTHVGSGDDLEVDTAMEVLSLLAHETIRATGGAEPLRPFAPFLLSLLDFIPQLSTSQIRQLFIILFSIGDISSSSNSGFDDVQIVIRKYLSQSSLSMKRIGIIGSVAFAVSRSSMHSRLSCNINDNSTEEESTTDVQEIVSSLQLVHKSCEPKHSIMHFSRHQTTPAYGAALSFFFDEIALAVRGGMLLPALKDWIIETFQDMLEYEYMGEFVENTNNREVQDKTDKQLIEGKSSNLLAPPAEMRFDIDSDEAVIYVKILSLACSGDTRKRAMPQYLGSLLQLLSSCNDERFGGEGVEEIDAILGCPIFLPAKDTLGIEFEDISEGKRLSSVHSIFYAACWCRELVNTFVMSAVKSKDGNDEIRSKIVRRLQNLVELEEELMFVAKKTYNFAPPGYPILFQPKELVQIQIANEKQIEQHVEPESTQDENCVNASPKKSNKPLRKAAQITKQLTAKHEKNKTKLMKLKRKYEADLSNRATDALRPLAYESVLALGFPELSVVQQGTNSEILSVGVSQLKMSEIGGGVVCLLFERLATSLRDSLSSSPTARRLALQKFRQSTNPSTSDIYISEPLPFGRNPYDFKSIKSDKSDTKYNMIDQYLEGNVFVAVFEHLAAFAETGYAEDDDLNVQKNHYRCLRLLFDTLRILSSSMELTSTKEGMRVLGKVLFQLSEGERRVPDSNADSSSMIKSLSVIFDLIEEIVSGFSCSGNLDFVLDGVAMLEDLILCARRLDKVTRKGKNDLSYQNQAPFYTENKVIASLCKKLSTLSHCLLQRQWDSCVKFTKSNVGRLLRLYIDSSFVPYASTVNENNDINKGYIEMGHNNAITHLVKDALSEIQHTPGCKGPVQTFPTLTSQSFLHYFSATLESLPRELDILFQPKFVDGADVSSKHLMSIFSVLKSLVKSLLLLFEIVKNNPTLVKSQCLAAQLKVGVKFLNTFTTNAVPFLQIYFEGNEQIILDIIATLQKSNRIVTTVVAYGRRKKDPALIKESPKAKKALESFIHKIKAMMKKNKCLSAYWGGNLLERNIDGSLYQEEEVESSSDDETIDDNLQGRSNESEDEGEERINLVETVI